MRKVVLILTISIFFSCNEGTKRRAGEILTDSNEKYKEYISIDCKKKIINKIEFEACIHDEMFIVKNSIRGIIYQENIYPFEFEFVDFNKDGFSDILINYVSNTPGLQDFLFFNSKTNTFEKLKPFNQFPNLKKIKNSNLYFSYHGSGCADNDWGSELYKIEGIKVEQLGHINGLGCLENDENGIYIFKKTKEGESLIKYIKREEGYWVGKWDFIDKYWVENIDTFI